VAECQANKSEDFSISMPWSKLGFKTYFSPSKRMSRPSSS